MSHVILTSSVHFSPASTGPCIPLLFCPLCTPLCILSCWQDVHRNQQPLLQHPSINSWQHFSFTLGLSSVSLSSVPSVGAGLIIHPLVAAGFSLCHIPQHLTSKWFAFQLCSQSLILAKLKLRHSASKPA